MNGLQIDLHATQPVNVALQLQVAPGELLALVGPSGGGKTSVLRAIAGLWPKGQLHGLVQCDGHTWLDTDRAISLPPQHRQVGMVFQNYALFPHLSVLDNVALAAPKGWTPLQVAALLQRMGLDQVQTRRPAQLSGGQQQRVALARALVRLMPSAAPDPGAAPLGTPAQPHTPHTPHGALLLDEPFSAVDAPTRHLLHRELALWRQHVKAPIVLVTHDLQEARQLADRVAIMDGGRCLQTGTPDQVFGQPSTARVAQLVGLRNLFKGDFQSHGNGTGQLLWRSPHQTAAVPLHVSNAPHNAPSHAPHITHSTAVDWAIHSDGAQVWPTAPPADTPNVLACTWGQMLAFGDTTWCQVQPNALPGLHLDLHLSTRQLQQWGALTGASVHLQLHPQAIHLMPLPSAQPLAPSLAAQT